jgi:hypothetical protein
VNVATSQVVAISKQPVPIRITITLPYQVFRDLQNQADQEGRSTSNLGAFLLENALGRAKKRAGSQLMVDSDDQDRAA